MVVHVVMKKVSVIIGRRCSIVTMRLRMLSLTSRKDPGFELVA